VIRDNDDDDDDDDNNNKKRFSIIEIKSRKNVSFHASCQKVDGVLSGHRIENTCPIRSLQTSKKYKEQPLHGI